MLSLSMDMYRFAALFSAERLGSENQEVERKMYPLGILSNDPLADFMLSNSAKQRSTQLRSWY